jgi:hypothetical protein
MPLMKLIKDMLMRLHRKIKRFRNQLEELRRERKKKNS